MTRGEAGDSQPEKEEKKIGPGQSAQQGTKGRSAAEKKEGASDKPVD